MTRAAQIVIIGNEILSGKVRDLNGPWLIDELRSLGTALERITVIPDRTPVIGATVAAASREADFVITTGGVGPTLDDVTFEGVAAAFGMPLRRFPELAQIIDRALNGNATAAHLKMADLPAESELLFTGGLRFPVVRVRNVFIFPGLPELLRKKFTAIREMFRETPFHLRRIFTTLEEGLVAPALDAVHARCPDVAIGSYPVFDSQEYSVQITLESKDQDAVARATEFLLTQLESSTIVRVE